MLSKLLQSNFKGETPWPDFRQYLVAQGTKTVPVASIKYLTKAPTEQFLRGDGGEIFDS